MQYIKVILISFILATTVPSFSGDSSKKSIDSEAREFLDDYLSVYNRRFGHPELSKQFREDLQNFVHDSLLLSPPTTPPQILPSKEKFAQAFEGFVTGLEKKGVVRLQWDKVQVKQLAPNKILANNIGHGVTDKGEVVYETISIYLLYKVDGDWKIAMFSPYLLENAIDII